VGGAADDSLIGGPGEDELQGGAGNDTINARDGVREQLNCGPGADTAIVDELDVIPQDPGSLCEAVDRSGAAPPPVSSRPSIRSSKLSVSKGRVSVSLSCAAACSGKLTLKTASKVKLGSKRSVVTLGSASYSVAAGKRATVRVKLSSKGRQLMRRVSRVRVKLTAKPKAGKAASKTLTLRG
jgi:Ca2+-binding RTX toxin-like protein